MGFPCRVAALLGLLLLLLAGDAAATGSLWLGYRCYMPGCTSCDNGNPYRCQDCGAGYVKLADSTCGCAAGYGSYAVPSVPRFPAYPPSCPTFMPAYRKARARAATAAAGATTSAANLQNLVVTKASRPNKVLDNSITPAATRVARTTITQTRTFSMNPTTMVTPMTLYRNRPNYCWWGYHATPVCQVPPDAGCGYCVCSVCPAGYTSAGGRSIATSMCVPKTAPTNVRCKGKPPQVPHAAPWAKTCSNILAGRKCGARGAPCNTNYVCEDCTPGFAHPVAYCKAPNGIWRVQGTCVAKAGMPDCPNRPTAGTNAQSWPADCVNGAASATPTVCNADCKAGFTGQVVATCSAAGWVVSGECVKDGPATTCSVSPDTQPNGLPFENCVDKEEGDICEAGCEDGFTGGYEAVCGFQLDGSMGFTIGGDCAPNGGATCAGPPEDISVEWPAECVNVPAEGTCPPDGGLAPCAAGFEGTGGTAFCIDDGTGNMFWDIAPDCAPTGEGSCVGLPDPNPADDLAEPWPEDDEICNLGAAGDVCFADCVPGVTGTGATATCNGDTGTWEIEVDCA